MAYQNQNQSGNYRKPVQQSAPARAAAVSTTAGSSERPAPLFSTGLFAPNKDGVKSIGGVQLKEAINLPAGSFINLYTVEPREGDKPNGPVYRIQVMPGTLKAK